MKKQMIFILLVSLVLIVPTSAHAVFVFDLIGLNGTAAPHPSGVGRRSGSISWGFSSTGAGFMNSRISLWDSYLLPANPGESTPFMASDVASVNFAHVENVFGTATPVAPIFSFSANNAEITQATGFVVNNGGGAYSLFSPFVQTSVELSLFRIPGGVVTGDAFLSGATVGLNARTINGVVQPPDTLALFIPHNEYTGNWQLTDRTSVSTNPIPEPATAVLLTTGLCGALLRQRFVQKA